MGDNDELEEMRMMLTNLAVRVETLESKRPGRKAKPVIVSRDHVCGVDPTSDSATCPWASLYRRQKGCKGDGCVKLSQEYYSARRKASE